MSGWQLEQERNSSGILCANRIPHAGQAWSLAHEYVTDLANSHDDVRFLLLQSNANTCVQHVQPIFGTRLDRSNLRSLAVYGKIKSAIYLSIKRTTLLQIHGQSVAIMFASPNHDLGLFLTSVSTGA